MNIYLYTRLIVLSRQVDFGSQSGEMAQKRQTSGSKQHPYRPIHVWANKPTVRFWIIERRRVQGAGDVRGRQWRGPQWVKYRPRARPLAHLIAHRTYTANARYENGRLQIRVADPWIIYGAVKYFDFDSMNKV